MLNTSIKRPPVIFRDSFQSALHPTNCRPSRRYCEYSFKSWERRRHLIPQADRVLPLVVAEPNGMTWRQLQAAVDLDPEILLKLVDGLMAAGMLVMRWEDCGPVYWTPH